MLLDKKAPLLFKAENQNRRKAWWESQKQASAPYQKMRVSLGKPDL